MMRFLPLLAFAALAAALAIGLFRDDRDVLRSTFLDEPAPSFSVPKYKAEGETVSLDSMKGEGPVVLNFWASWCGPCIVEHPEITKLSKLNGVRVFGINYKDKAVDAQRFLDRYGDPFTAIGVDEKGRAGIEYGVTALPETFVLNGEGRVIYKHTGPIGPGDYDEKLLPAIEAAR